MTARSGQWRGQRAGLIVCGCVFVGLLVLSELLQRATAPGDAMDNWPWWATLLPVAGLGGGGIAVLWRLPGHGVGRVLLLFGAWFALDSWCGAHAGWTLTSGAPGGPLAWWWTARAGAGLQLAMPLLLLVYPDGRLPRGRWRVPAWTALGASALILAAGLVVPFEAVDRVDPQPSDVLERDYLVIPALAGVDWTSVRLVAGGILAPALLIAVARLLLLARGGDGRDPVLRTRARWLVWAGLIDVLALVTTVTLHLPEVLSLPLFVGGMGVSGAGAAIGLLAPDLLDIGRLLNATVVYGVVAVGLLAVDALLVAGVVALGAGHLPDRDGAVLAVLLVAAVYGPLRERLWNLVRRAVLGERGDRYRVVSDLAGALEVGPDVPTRLHAVAAAGVRAFRYDFVAVEVLGPDGLAVQSSSGTRPPKVRTIPLRYRGIDVGRLTVAPPAPGGTRDEELLAELARQAAVALRTEELTADLRRRRAELVRTREDARRRLRQDLHDELAPTLAGAAVRLDHAAGLVPTDPVAAGNLLAAARDDLAGAVADVRRLAAGLRPPALDGVGLAGAVRRLAERRTAAGVRIDVTFAQEPSVLPAAVEVVALLVVSEALADAARSGARHVQVQLEPRGRSLQVQVHDDARGARNPGSGARERVAELGGRWWCEGGPGGRTVRAGLPLTVGAGSASSEEVLARG